MDVHLDDGVEVHVIHLFGKITHNMPTISRIFLKVALIWFLAALVTGALMAFGGPRWLAILLPTYLHLFVVGWVTQMIVGVAIWLFPKYSKERPRGWETLSWVTLIALNVGLLLRAIAEPGPMWTTSDWWAPMLVVSAILQWLGGVAFVVNIWPRVKGRKS